MEGKTKRDKIIWPELIVFIIFLCPGIFFLIAGFLRLCRIMPEADRVWTEGRVVRIEEHRDSDNDIIHTPYVRYTVDGVEYTTTKLPYRDADEVGKSVAFFYDRNDPQNVQVKNQHTAAIIIYFSLGVLFSAPVIYLLVINLSHDRKSRGSAGNAPKSPGVPSRNTSRRRRRRQEQSET